MHGEPLLAYLTLSNHAVSMVLIVERNQQELLVYYVSHVWCNSLTLIIFIYLIIIFIYLFNYTMIIKLRIHLFQLIDLIWDNLISTPTLQFTFHLSLKFLVNR